MLHTHEVGGSSPPSPTKLAIRVLRLRGLLLGGSPHATSPALSASETTSVRMARVPPSEDAPQAFNQRVPKRQPCSVYTLGVLPANLSPVPCMTSTKGDTMVGAGYCSPEDYYYPLAVELWR